MNAKLLFLVAAMIVVVVASNFMVNYPFQVTIGGYNFADLLTWGAFTYPVAYLVTDLTNRTFGPGKARIVAFFGFAAAVILSAWLVNVRIAVASGTAFLVSQFLDIYVFNKLREKVWWRAPLTSSFFGSLIDTAIFFSLAFAASFTLLGPSDGFFTEATPLLGLFTVEFPRWVSFALGDLGVKLLVALALLIPYGALRSIFAKAQPA